MSQEKWIFLIKNLRNIAKFELYIPPCDILVQLMIRSNYVHASQTP